MAQVKFIAPVNPMRGSAYDFSTPSIWSTGTVPGAADDVTIATAMASVYSTTLKPVVHSLYLGWGSQLSTGAFRALTDMDVDGAVVGTSIRSQFLYGNGAINASSNITVTAILGQLVAGVGVTATHLSINQYSGTAVLSSGSLVSQFAGTFGGDGTINLHHGTYNLLSGAQLSVANLTVSGANVYFGANFTYAGHLSMSDGGLYLGAFQTGPDTQLTLTGPTTLTGGVIVGGGTDSVLNLKGATTFSGYEQVSGNARVVNYGNAVENGGTLTLGAAGQGGATLVNAKGANLFLSGSILDGGGSTAVVNAGGIGSGGYGKIEPTLFNSGGINVVQGVLDIAGPVYGTGSMSVGTGILELDSSVASTQSVSLNRWGDELILGDAHDFHGSIQMTFASLLDLSGFSTIGEKLSFTPNTDAPGGTLHVTSGSQTAALTFAGDVKASDFSTASDQRGGTLIDFGTHPIAGMITPHG